MGIANSREKVNRTLVTWTLVTGETFDTLFVSGDTCIKGYL